LGECRGDHRHQRELGNDGCFHEVLLEENRSV
jgi:hypothetical protein